MKLGSQVLITETVEQTKELGTDYIPREQAIYEDIIGNKLTSLSGTVTELAERYNVPKAYIAGFVDGINETQPEKIELETLTDDTQINLVIDLKSSTSRW